MIRSFTVTPVLNGYVVSVGCQVIVFTSGIDLTNAISAYLDNPDMVEKSFTEDSINSKHLMPQTRPENYTQPCEPCPQDVNPGPTGTVGSCHPQGPDSAQQAPFYPKRWV